MALKIDYSLRLPDDQFFLAARKKTGIAIHHTVGGTVFSTVIIDHQNAEFWREQKDKLLAVDSLRVQVVALQDSIATLHALNTLALQAGYDNASTQYRDQTTRYIAELKKPRFSLGSTVGLCLGSAGAGLIIGTLIQH